MRNGDDITVWFGLNGTLDYTTYGAGASGEGTSLMSGYVFRGTLISSLVADVIENFNHYLYMFLVFIPLTLLIIGIKKEIPAFIMLAGILLTGFAVALYADRFPNLSFDTDLLTRAFTVTILGLGLYIIGKISIEWSREAIL